MIDKQVVYLFEMNSSENIVEIEVTVILICFELFLALILNIAIIFGWHR